VLIACPACRRQYQTGDLSSGARVRCTCGEKLTVPEPRSRQAEMLHCSNCGAALGDATDRCEYCDARLGIADRGYGDPCPECFARLIRDARFCSACGIAIRPMGVIVREETDAPCPRCRTHLIRCKNDRADFLECTGCGGLWLDELDFERRVEARDLASTPLDPGRPLPRRQPEKDVRYLPCPRCSSLMLRRNFGRVSGVVIDFCRGHGYWFDTHELEHIQRFIDAGGMERKRRIEDREEKARREKTVEAHAEAQAKLFAAQPPRRQGNELIELLLDALGGFFR